MCRTIVSSFLSLPRLCLGALTTHVGLAVVLGLAVILVVRYSKSPWRRVPPGPRGLPLIGNALDLQDKDWLFRGDCKQKYSAFFLFFLSYIVFTSLLCSRRCDVFNCARPAYPRLE